LHGGRPARILGAVTSQAAFTAPADSAGPCSPHAVAGLEPGATSFDRPGAIPGIRRARIAAPYTFKGNSSTAGWILIGLLLAFGVAMLRKTHPRRPVI
jgi:hypothetical protein